MNKTLNPVVGSCAHHVDVCRAIDIFQSLAGALTPARLGEAMLGLVHVYLPVQRGWVLVREGEHFRPLAAANWANLRLAGPSSDGLPPALSKVLDAVVTPGLPAIVEIDGSTAVAVAVAGADGTQRALLCTLGTAAPDEAELQTLHLIGACGGTVLHALAQSGTALHVENDELREQVKTRLALASHLADEQGLLRTLIDNMPDQIYVKDIDGRFVIGNRAAAECIGVATPEDLVGKCDLEFFPDACGERFFRDEQAIMRSGQPIVDQVEENINAAGVRRWFSTTKVPFRDDQGRVIGIVGMSRDVSLRVAADEAIRLRNRAIESSLDAIVITDPMRPGNPVVYVNPAFGRITGFSAEDASRDGIAHLLESVEEGEEAQQIATAMRMQVEGRAVIQSRRKDGSVFWNEVRVAPVRDLRGEATHFVYTMTDITKARDAEEQLERLASHDILTGLPNRRMLMDRLGQAIAMGERGNFVVAVAFIDLDRLKYVNDNLGHEAGDLLLRTVAERMRACVRKSDTVARLGGDEFVLITLHNTLFESASAPGLGQNYAYVQDMLAKLQAALYEPMLLGAERHQVTCSIGVSIYPQHGADPDSLLKHADAAMYSAKKNGRNNIKFYSNDPARA